MNTNIQSELLIQIGRVVAQLATRYVEEHPKPQIALDKLQVEANKLTTLLREFTQ